MTPSTRRLGGGEGVSSPTISPSPNIRLRPSNMAHSTSSQSLLSLAKDVMGSSLANEMDTDEASCSDFSQGRCYNDVAGKTNVLLSDDEMVSTLMIDTKLLGCLLCGMIDINLCPLALPIEDHFSLLCHYPFFTLREKLSGRNSSPIWEKMVS